MQPLRGLLLAAALLFAADAIQGSLEPNHRANERPSRLINQLWSLVHRRAFLVARDRSIGDLDERIERLMQRMEDAGMTDSDARWELKMAEESARKLP
jgi:hypothetical protein